MADTKVRAQPKNDSLKIVRTTYYEGHLKSILYARYNQMLFTSVKHTIFYNFSHLK